MIRFVVALFAFAVLLCGYIVLRPDSGVQMPMSESLGVTRAQSDSILGPVPDVLASLDTATLTPAPVRPAAPSLMVASTNADMAVTSANVLAGLGLNTAPAAEADDPMREMTASIISGIGTITGKTVTTSDQPAAATTALELLVVKALKEGQNDAYIDTMVNAAAKAGEIVVPDVLVTSDGDVDTAILLESIIVQAQIAAGGAAPAVPDVPTGDGSGVEVRIVQRATETEQYRFYTVASGDSLGAIAVKFYGSVEKYDLIFQANRKVLSSPNAIQVGQRLAIPELAG